MTAPEGARPLRHRHGAAALARAPEHPADTLYVVGGLYGNLAALDAVEALASLEPRAVVLCFNGDFNEFNVDDTGFVAINRRVLAHHASLGTAEAELLSGGGDAPCGYAYPANTDLATVERSSQIHARLRVTSANHGEIVAQLATLPMVRRYRVGELCVGVVHGDAESLAGRRFDVAALDDPGQSDWRERAFADARVNLFASSHTGLPALRCFEFAGDQVAVINSGAAGMPNFSHTRFGAITRVATSPAPFAPLYGTRLGRVSIDSLPVAYDAARWQRQFLANWPPGSPAHESCYERILRGPDFGIRRAGALHE